MEIEEQAKSSKMRIFYIVLFFLKHQMPHIFINLIRKQPHKNEFRKNYFLAIIIVVCFFYSLLIVYIVYHSCRSSLEEHVIIEAQHINNTLTTILDETAFVMTFVGKQIAQHEHANVKHISKILIDSSKIPYKNQPIYSWSLFDWVDPDGHMLVNSQIGITKSPYRKVFDSYVWKCSKNPWTLQLSPPTVGNTSGMWVIPTGMGVSDSTNKYLGALNVAFNVAELNSKIEQSLVDKSGSFLVLDENFRIVLQSTDNAINPKSSYYYDLLHDSNYLLIKSQGSLIKPIYYKDISYFQYIKMTKYPYIILTGFKKSVFIREFQSLIIPRIIEFIAMGCFCSCLLYFSRRKFLNLLSFSNQIKESFFHRVNLELYASLRYIINSSNILLRGLKNEIEIGMNKEEQIILISQIYDEAVKLNTLTIDVLDLSYINVNKAIVESITINTQTALIKNIKVKCSLASHLPPLYGDELRFRQIISGLLNLSLEYNPQKSTITLFSVSRKIKNKTFLIIKIEDNGFSLNIEDIRRISNNANNKKEGNRIHLDFSSIEKIIKLYYGKCSIYDKRHKGQMKGKIVSIIIPYHFPENLAQLS